MKYETKTKEEIHWNAILEEAIFWANYSICRCKEDTMTWLFEHEQQHMILQDIQYMITDEYWIGMRGF